VPSVIDTPARQHMKTGAAKIARMEKELEWMGSGRRWWAAGHPTEWPSVLLHGVDRVAELPDAAHDQVTGVVDAWSVAAAGVWELGRLLWREGVSRVDNAATDAWSELQVTAGGLVETLLRAPWLAPDLSQTDRLAAMRAP